MPDLDFPSSPTTGTQYNNWVYNGAQWDFAQTLPGGLPAGSIIQWGGATAPVNWLLCDGSAVSRTTYASLFAAVGTAYGTGDGTTTFNLPDLRGRVPVGKNGGSFGTLGATGGAETVTLDGNNLPAHTHTFSAITSSNGDHSHTFGANQNGVAAHATGGGGYNVGFTNAGSGEMFFYRGMDAAGSHNHSVSGTTGSAGSGTAVNNLQPYQVVNYIIKATAASTPGDSELAPRIGVLEATNVLSQNYLINGAFDIWQRGTSLTQSGGGVGVDMWREYTDTGSGTQTKDTSVTGPSGVVVAQQSYKFTAGASATNWTLFQIIETLNAANLAGKTVTLSAYMSSSSARNFALTMAYSTTVDAVWTGTWVTIGTSTVAVGTSMSRVSATFVVPATAKTLQVGINTGGTNLSASASVNVTGVQLEEGSFATPFRRNTNSVQAELAACQRYFQTYGGSQANIEICHGTVSTGTNAVTYLPLIVEMRTAPSFSAAAAGNFQQHVPGVVISTCTLVALNLSSSKLISLNTTAGSGFTPGHNVKIQSLNTSGIIQLSAEL